MTLSPRDKYLSYRGFLEVSSGTTRNCHVALKIQIHFWSESYIVSNHVWEYGTKNTPYKTLSYRFRGEVAKSGLQFLNVRKLGGSIGICHQNELSSADHSALQCGRIETMRQQAKLVSGRWVQVHSSWTPLVSPFAQHLLSPCSSPVSWPAPYLARTLLCTAMQPERRRGQDKSFLATESPAHFPFKKKKKYHLSGLVFAAIIDYNDLIGKRRVLFLWKNHQEFTK